MGNDHTCKIVDIQSVSLKFQDGSVALLRNIRHVPTLRRNLICLGMLDSIGCKYQGSTGRCEIKQDSKVVLVGIKTNGLYLIKDVQMTHSTLIATDNKLTKGYLWHKRLSHISGKGLKILSEQGLLPRGLAKDLTFCKYCVGNPQDNPSKRQNITLRKSWDMSIHIYGANSDSLLKWIKVFSRKSWVFLKTQDQTLEKFKGRLWLKSKPQVKCFRTDNGLDFCNEEFSNFCKQHGIIKHRAVRHSPTKWSR